MSWTADDMLSEVLEHTWTREELLAARERPPVTTFAPAAHRLRQRATRSKRPFKAKTPRPPATCGTLAHYSTGCRLEPCLQARRVYDQQRRIRRAS